MSRSHNLNILPDQPLRKPPWLRVKLPAGHAYHTLRQNIDGHHLHTVCQSAMCPNLGECWSRGTATVLILGNTCTRNCTFCNISTGNPQPPDLSEPQRVAESIARMNLKHCVITSVTRDDLPDGGADIWAETITRIRVASPTTTIEVLIPDFAGNWSALQQVLDAKPNILNHNIETVPSQYPRVRPQAQYERSLELLRRAKVQGFTTKTGLMVGLGETDDELYQLFCDLRANEVDILTIGQYLQPTKHHLPIVRWVHPDTFAAYKKYCLEELHFSIVESAPLVRSSYHADEQVPSHNP